MAVKLREFESIKDLSNHLLLIKTSLENADVPNKDKQEGKILGFEYVLEKFKGILEPTKEPIPYFVAEYIDRAKEMPLASIAQTFGMLNLSDSKVTEWLQLSTDFTGVKAEGILNQEIFLRYWLNKEEFVVVK